MEVFVSVQPSLQKSKNSVLNFYLVFLDHASSPTSTFPFPAADRSVYVDALKSSQSKSPGVQFHGSVSRFVLYVTDPQNKLTAGHQNCLVG